VELPLHRCVRELDALRSTDVTRRAVHTMDELRLTGNCLKGSRPFLSFDKSFDKAPHLSLLKEMFIQVFNVPRGHPKSQPFFGHVLSFYVVDGKIWVRHYQVRVHVKRSVHAVACDRRRDGRGAGGHRDDGQEDGEEGAVGG
jgi:ribosome biogenesis protein BRX1